MHRHLGNINYLMMFAGDIVIVITTFECDADPVEPVVAAVTRHEEQSKPSGTIPAIPSIQRVIAADPFVRAYVHHRTTSDAAAVGSLFGILISPYRTAQETTGREMIHNESIVYPTMSTVNGTCARPAR